MSWMPWLETLLAQFGRKRSSSGNGGSIRVKGTRAYRRLRTGATKEQLAPHLGSLEQTNTSVVYGDRFVLKVYRALERGENPEIEMSRFLTQRAGFENTPPLAGALEYERKGEGPASLGVLQGFVPNQGDAWKHTLEMLDGYFERVIPYLGEVSEPPVPRGSHVHRTGEELPAVMREVIGVYEPLVRLLGQRTAEMHLALASATGDDAFEPEEFSTLHQRSLYQSARGKARQTFQSLRRRIKTVPDELREPARAMLDRQGEVDALFKRVVGHKIEAVRVRTHGDYHLGQVLYTGKDFVIIDFEGEPARPIGERRFKRSPLRDVAGMLRSFHYAAVAGLYSDHIRQEDRELLAPWAAAWHDWVVAAYLDAWLQTAGETPIVPRSRDDLETLLDFYLLDKCVYELGYELDNRPRWVSIPLRGLMDLLGPQER